MRPEMRRPIARTRLDGPVVVVVVPRVKAQLIQFGVRCRVVDQLFALGD